MNKLYELFIYLIYINENNKLISINKNNKIISVSISQNFNFFSDAFFLKQIQLELLIEYRQ